jgi:hypothetical protein
MAKDYFVTLGGRKRLLRFTLDDREFVEDMFPGPDCTPGNLMDLCMRHLSSLRGSFKVQAAIVFAALRHDKHVTLDLVREWLKDAFKPGSKPIDVFRPVIECISASGVLGFTVEEPPQDDPEGKERAAEPVKAAE